MGLFKPGWQKGDYKQRMAYVEKMTNPKKLTDVVNSGYCLYASFVAAKKLADKALAQEVFVKIACEWAFDDAIQIEAINRITNQKLLLKVIIEGHAIYPMKITAAKKLTDPIALTELANTERYIDDDIRNIAKAKLQQPIKTIAFEQPRTQVVDLRSDSERKVEQESGNVLENAEHEAFAQALFGMFKASRPYDSMVLLEEVTRKYSPTAQKIAAEGHNPVLKKIYYRVMSLCKSQGVYFHAGTLNNIFSGEYWSI